MPYKVRKDGSAWCVVNTDTDQVKGRAKTKKSALRFLRALYANVPDAGKSLAPGGTPDVLVVYGGEIKALGDGRYGGQALIYGDETKTDLSPKRDFFTPATDFWVDDEAQWGQVSVPLIYNHGLDPELKKVRLGRATYARNPAGVWAEWQLKLRKDYEDRFGEHLKEIAGMIERKKLGLSTGVPGHLVEREPRGQAHYVKSWPLDRSELSLTPTPAEPRTLAVSLKSLIEHGPDGPATRPSLVEDTRKLATDGRVLRDRLAKAIEQRRRDGRHISAEKLETLKGLHREHAELVRQLGQLVEAAAPRRVPLPGPDELARLLSRFA